MSSTALALGLEMLALEEASSWQAVEALTVQMGQDVPLQAVIRTGHGVP